MGMCHFVCNLQNVPVMGQEVSVTIYVKVKDVCGHKSHGLHTAQVFMYSPSFSINGQKLPA